MLFTSFMVKAKAGQNVTMKSLARHSRS